MKLLIQKIFSKPYPLFFGVISYLVISTYIKFGFEEAIILVSYDLFFLFITKLIFWRIGDRLIFTLTRNNKLHEVLRGYLFAFTFFFPWVALLFAICSKLIHWNRYKHKKQFSYYDQVGNKITKIFSENPTVIVSRGEGEQEEHIITTKFRKLPKKIIYE